ncbi:MAG TPA: STAS/SEC14 domain-containing protein [Burkholderiales bacterium]|nr:STAS/SEC14 domain-containing protein [Betaproteobacteria bacterium]HQR53742.1 STAS/SEC14 domain-containing protein [Burkholderiales bacterium]
MISIQIADEYTNVAVLGEFTLADMKELEEHAIYQIRLQGSANLLIDLRDMLGYTLDVAWEELKFTRTHAREFGRVAVVTDNQWLAWIAWLESLFTDAEIEVFASYDDALAWVTAADAGSGEPPTEKS